MAITTINENGMYNLLGAMVNQAYEDIEKNYKEVSKGRFKRRTKKEYWRNESRCRRFYRTYEGNLCKLKNKGWNKSPLFFYICF